METVTMRKIGKILIVFGIIWMASFLIEVGPYERSLEMRHFEKFNQQLYTRQDISEVVRFAQNGLYGILMMAVGLAILEKAKMGDPDPNNKTTEPIARAAPQSGKSIGELVRATTALRLETMT